MWSHPPTTLPDLVDHFAAEQPDALAYAYLSDGETIGDTMTYGELRRSAAQIAARLRTLVAPGSRMVLVHRPGLDFLRAFFGACFAGIVAVPVYPPERSRWSADLARIASIASDCDAALIHCDEELLELMSEIALAQPELAARQWTSLGDWEDFSPSETWRQVRSEQLAMLQYTSGSVAAPKGVMLSHANLLANQASIRESMAIPDRPIFVSWLPLYHDMGLIGEVMQPLYMGGCCYLMSPQHFVQKPSRWLRAVHRFRAQVSGGPNFAFELCLSRITDQARADLDLSCWKVAFCGAEPIRADVMRRFTEAFEPLGLDPGAIYPCYGLAESSLLVTGATPAAGAHYRTVEAAALGEGRAVPRSEGDLIELVSSGRPPSNQRVEIVDISTGCPVEDGVQGEIWVNGDSVAKGYWGNTRGTTECFPAREDGTRWLRTGDVGFRIDGELFIIGRAKEAIIVRGRNIIPQDVEALVQGVSPLFRIAGGAAFAVQREGQERLVVVQEVARVRRQGLAELAAEAAQRVLGDLQVAIHELVLVEPKGVPKTRNGKIGRVACRAAYLSDDLPIVGVFSNGAFHVRQELVDATR